MKQFLNQMFVMLGVIFFIILLALAYVFVTDTYSVRTMLLGSNTSSTLESNEQEGGSARTYAGFGLSEGQKQALISAGVDPASVPNSITGEQESCMVSVFGEARTSEIRNGAVPNAVELARAKSCI